MSTTFTNQTIQRATMSLSLCIAMFMLSTFSAHASDIEKISRMENQLKTAEAILSSMMKQITPQGAVLGASTSEIEAELQAQIAALLVEVSNTSSAATTAELQAQIAALMAQITALNGGTSAAVVPVRPACRLTLDKKVYTLGDTIKVSWKTTGSSYVEFVPDTSGKDSLTLPGGKLDTADSENIVADVLGNPMISLKVTSPTGQSITCSKVFPIVASDATVKDVRVAPMQATLIKMANQAQKLVVQQEAVAAKILQLQIDSLNLQIKIDQIINGPKGDVKGASIEDFDSRVEMTEGNESRGDYRLDFAVTANDADIFVGPSGLRGKASTKGNPDVIYRIVNTTTGKTATSGVATAVLNSSADEEGIYYEVQEGDTEDFTLDVTFLPRVGGTYSVELVSLQWKPDSLTAPVEKKSFKPGTYRSDALVLKAG